jgi:hypothetical protein
VPLQLKEKAPLLVFQSLLRSLLRTQWGSSSEMSANMSMMLMCQLDSINRSMGNKERREENRRKKKRIIERNVAVRRRGRRHRRGQPMKASRTMDAMLGGNTVVAVIAIVATVIVATAAALHLPIAAIMVGGVSGGWETTTDHLDKMFMLLIILSNYSISLPSYDYSSLLSLLLSVLSPSTLLS